MLMAASQLNPIPEETLSLAEQVEELRQENKRLIDNYNFLKTEMEQINKEIGSLAQLKAEVSQIKKNFEDSQEQILGVELIDDRKRITALEDLMTLPAQPRPKQRDQGDILRLLLASGNGEFVPAKIIRRKMGLSDVQFSQLLKVSKSWLEIKEYSLDRRQKLLKIKH
jgi:chromosome segregation ATPase